ncbi:MAG TPA: MoxR family ATPase [Frankiaceae bacterium]|nr:MoxR family ATPase [Frankiaceae bacterium]
MLDAVDAVVVGKRPALELVLLGILSRGHVLLEDNPGLGKTLMARSFAQALGMEFKRIQFTPDLLPSDVTGSYVYDQRNGSFEFRRGPLFTNLLLADEINRTPPKTQAALLEVMQEAQVTVEGTTFPMVPPFTVLATQNPIEYEGTYPLPEAQLDRFVCRVRLGYPSRDDEWEVLRQRIERRVDDITVEPVVTRDEVLALQASVEQVEVEETVGRYMVDLAAATRTSPQVLVGASPRGALALLKLSRGKALLDGRDYVTPDDVKAVAVPALGHRVTLRPEMWVRRVTGDDVVAQVLSVVPTPPTVAPRR